MATGISAAVANAILDALCRSVAWTEPAAFYVKLHLGDPGASGASNAAANTTRQSVTFSAASAGAITNSAAVTWTSVPNTETYSHISFWQDSKEKREEYVAALVRERDAAVVRGNDRRAAEIDAELRRVQGEAPAKRSSKRSAAGS